MSLKYEHANHDDADPAAARAARPTLLHFFFFITLKPRVE